MSDQEKDNGSGAVAEIDRRTFLASSATGAVAAGMMGWPVVATASRPAPQPPRRAGLRLGFVGCGQRGIALMLAASRAPRIQVAAACDLYDGHLARVHEIVGNDVSTTRDWKTLLQHDDLDVIVIATPDFTHATLLRGAIATGRNVYCEGPASWNLDETNALWGMSPAPATMIHIGSPGLSAALVQGARQLVRDGCLGAVYLAEARHDAGGSLEAWQAPFPPDASPATVDWQQFASMATGQAAFSLHRFFRWRCYWEYGTGLAGDGLFDLVSAIHAILDLNAPEQASAFGGVYRWKDGRNTPDVFSAQLHYPEGIMVRLDASLVSSRADHSLTLHGTEATAVLDAAGLRIYPSAGTEPYASATQSWAKDRREWFAMIHGLDAAGMPRRAPAPPLVESRVAAPEEEPEAGFLAFLSRVRSQATEPGSLQARLQATVAIHLANLACRRNRPMVWQRETRTWRALNT